MEPYRPDGTFRPSDAIVLLIASLSGGIAVGLVFHLVGLAFRLLILFPLGMGLCVGLAASAVVKWRRIRAPLAAAVIAALGGAIAWTTDLTTPYPGHRASMRREVVSLKERFEATMGRSLPDDRVDLAVNEAMVRLGRGEEMSGLDVVVVLTGEPAATEEGGVVSPRPPASALDAFRGWLDVRRGAGTSISRFSSGSGIKLDGKGTAALWILEILLAAGVAYAMTYSAAKEPYCEGCQNWYGEAQELLPVAEAGSKEQLLQAIERGEASRLKEVVSGGPLRTPFLGVRMRACRNCREAPIFTEIVEVRAGQKKNELKVVRAGFVRASVVEDILKALRPASRPPEG